MLIEQLEAGSHLSSAEFTFVMNVVAPALNSFERENEIDEKTLVVGSRPRGARVGTHLFSIHCRQLPPAEQRYWYQLLNNTMIRQDFSCSQIHLLEATLPDEVPSCIRKMFEEDGKNLGADLDLLVNVRGREIGINFPHRDTTTGLYVGTWSMDQFPRIFINQSEKRHNILL